jgi:hypothetical protein
MDSGALRDAEQPGSLVHEEQGIEENQTDTGGL